MAKKKNLTPEKAAEKISKMISKGAVKTPAEAVKERPELKPGLSSFEKDTAKPKSRGSGSALLSLGR